MKTKIAAALSLAGVLVAGSAAALVNTQVLQNNSNEATTVPALAAPAGLLVTTTTTAGVETSLPIDATSTTVVGGAPSTSVDSTAPVSTAPASTAPTAGATPTQAVYRIGDAGTVTLDTAGDRLTVVAATPSAGWQVGKVEQRSPLDIEIYFRSATVELEFKANLLFGVVSTSVESRTVGAPPAGGTAAPGPSTSVHDDDDDSEQHDDSSGGHHGGEHEDDDD
ncbi:MAG: hypothetical protein WCP59_18080 [Actinomycetota bacterium]|jgi:hypothetical protein